MGLNNNSTIQQFNNLRPQGESGFTLLEAIIAISILLVGTIGAMTLISRSIAGFGVSKENLIATNLAQEGLEIIHNIRDNNWLDGAEPDWNDWGGKGPPWDDWRGDGVADSCSPCRGYVFADINSGDLRTDATGTILRWNNDKNVYDDGGTGAGFYRRITITDLGVDYVSVKSTIGWGDAGSCASGDVTVFYQHCLTLEERLYDWR